MELERRDFVDLLYTAHGRFKSIRLSWTYIYDESLMRQRLEDSSAQYLRGVSASSSEMTNDQQAITSKVVRRRIWWQRPGRWREEHYWDSEAEPSITIISDDLFWWYNPKSKAMSTNSGNAQAQLFADYEVEHTASSQSIEDATVGIQLLDPSFLLVSHTFEFIGETVHAGREGIAVRGKYLKHREFMFEDFFWATADEYAFIVDREYGILLRYAYILDNREIAVSSVNDVTFDQPIPTNVFSPGPVAGS